MAKDKGSLAEQSKTDHRGAVPKDSDLDHKVPVEDIETNTSARSIGPDAVDALARSFAVSGQINPITITRTPDGRFTVVAGNHRLAAARKLGWQEIDAKIVDLDDVDREIWQIDENLVRTELTELEFAEQLQRRKELFDQKGGEKISTPGGEQKIGFDRATATRIGRSKSAIQKARKRAEKITPKVRDKIRDTPAADKGAELDALAAMPPTNQARATKLYLDNKVESIRKARSQINAKPKPSRRGQDDRDFERLKAAWEKSSPGGRRMFDDWRSQVPKVEDGADEAAKDTNLEAASSCAEPIANGANGFEDDRDQATTAEPSNGQAHSNVGEINIDKMGKNDLLAFAAANGIKPCGLEQRPIAAIKEILKRHIRDDDAPEGGWKLLEVDRLHQNDEIRRRNPS